MTLTEGKSPVGSRKSWEFYSMINEVYALDRRGTTLNEVAADRVES
jgi:hypothetical protein